MARSLTLKNLPEALYERLQASARHHRRSLNSEAIVCLESVLQPPTPSGAVRLEQLSQLRTTLPPDAVFDPEEINAFKREGRP
jgi:plasmid stability protein